MIADELIPALDRILSGYCDPAIAEDRELFYADAVELQLLLEQVERREPAWLS